jgi:hypothetical protein
VSKVGRVGVYREALAQECRRKKDKLLDLFDWMKDTRLACKKDRSKTRKDREEARWS